MTSAAVRRDDSREGIASPCSLSGRTRMGETRQARVKSPVIVGHRSIRAAGPGSLRWTPRLGGSNSAWSTRSVRPIDPGEPSSNPMSSPPIRNSRPSRCDRPSRNDRPSLIETSLIDTSPIEMESGAIGMEWGPIGMEWGPIATERGVTVTERRRPGPPFSMRIFRSRCIEMTRSRMGGHGRRWPRAGLHFRSLIHPLKRP
jgi:hypothetical protein